MLLNCHSYYSFHYGTLAPDRLIESVLSFGYDRFALTDINSTAACLDIYRRLQEHPELKASYGVDFRNGNDQQFVAIARNNSGFQELNSYLSIQLHQGLAFPDRAPAFKQCYIIYPFAKAQNYQLAENEYIGLSQTDIKRLRFSKWKNRLDKLVLLQETSFRNPQGFQTHVALRAIGENQLLEKMQAKQLAPQDAFMQPAHQLLKLLEPFPQILSNTLNILDDCSLHFDFHQNKNRQVFSGSAQEDFELLDRLCQEGLKYRFKEPDQASKDRIEMELEMIKKLGFASYFLINWDLVRYARHKGYYYVGRGSGANSMVAYVLRITDVNPIELNLYFERFINPYRSSPPDFDIDFNWTDRDDVTRYLFDTYGAEHTALMGTYVTLKHKAVYRELGKVFGLPSDEIARLQQHIRVLGEMDRRLQQQAFHRLDSVEQKIHSFARVLAGFPHHSSVHSSGIIITDQPTAAYSATFMPPKGFPTTQIDMHLAEDVGIYKFDILSQRGLGKIKGALDWIKVQGEAPPDIHDIRSFQEDPKLKKMLKTGDCVACFYIESPAMRALLTKLKAEDYNRLVAASSIIRPGVAKSGMMGEYIQRFQHPEKREVAKRELPEFYELLEDTFGVMVYQEDVLKVAHYFAGLSLAEADVLRRGMNFKYRERNAFWKVKDKFVQNCLNKGYKQETVDSIWTQIESFGNYAFAKGHSASYAVESFQALYLKAYYPLEYMTATLNNGGGFYRAELYLHEAKIHGAKIELPCVNRSHSGCRLMGKQIVIGLGFVKDLESKTTKMLLEERAANGMFRSLRDVVKRTNISLEQICILIRVGAFRFTEVAKKKLLWDAHFLLGHQPKPKPALNLFEIDAKTHKLPQLWQHDLEDAYDEMELLGFCVTSSPFQLVDRSALPSLKPTELKGRVGKRVRIIGYLIHRKLTSTHKQERMSFGTFIGLDGTWLDSVHFPKVTKQYPFTGPGIYLLEGEVQDDYGFITLQVSYMERIPNRNLMDPSKTQLELNNELVRTRKQAEIKRLEIQKREVS